MIVLDLQTYGTSRLDPECSSAGAENMVYPDAFAVNVLSLLNVLCFLFYLTGRAVFPSPFG